MITSFAKKVLEERYLLRDKRKVVETPAAMFERVAKAVASVEKKKSRRKKWQKIYFDMMYNLKFLPNSPTLANAGARTGQLAGCFVIPIEDSMEGIFGALKNMALIQKTGGGTGMSFSRLRPRGSYVKSTGGKASGPVSFMTAFDAASNSIKQGGMRRGANMGILRVDHPDILEFVRVKKKEGVLANFNISVAVTDEFMKAVELEEKYFLVDPHTKKPVQQVDAKEVFDEIVQCAWECGDPGLCFLDTINRKHPVDEEIESVNPCGEQPLTPYESCNLGSINLSRFVSGKRFNEEKLAETVWNAVRFLDSVIDIQKFPLSEIEEQTKKYRKVGLGVMGWHDALIQLGVPYDSEIALELVHEIMGIVEREAFDASVDLASEKGPFPEVENTMFKNMAHPPRNACRTTIAPTGTIGTIAGCSTGIEPHYRLVYKRILMDETFVVKNPYFDEIAEELGLDWERLIENDGTLTGLRVPINVKNLFKTALEIPPRIHVKVQAAFQTYIDSGVSKTINMPEETTVEEVYQVFMDAWKLGCKGLTVFRDGCRIVQAMSTAKEKEIKPKDRPEVVDAKVVKVQTGCGNLYTTIGFLDGEVFELLTSIGHAGGCAQANTEALCRIMSVALRAGVSKQEMITQLRGIRCPHQVTSKGNVVLSCPDGIGLALEKITQGKTPPKVVSPCPKCGEKLMFEEGCHKCVSCDYMRCG